MDITLESHLKEVSEKEGSKLYSNWMVIKEELCSKLETVTSYFQHFSLHNATHCKEICNNIERFLGEERIKKLSPTDTWLLLMAFYSHDVGMALKYDDIVKKFEDEKFIDELDTLIESNNVDLKEAAERVLAFEKDNDSLKPVKGKALDIFRDVQLIIEEHYRKGHAVRSAEYIGAFLDDRYSIINPRIIELLKKVCIAHQEDIHKIENLHYEENGLFQDYVHPRFVAGMLCLGDLLDMDTNRFNKYGLEAASTLTDESKLHLKKHRALKHFLIKPNGIEIELDSPNMDVHRVARDWVQWIDETVDYLTLKWSCVAPKNFGNPPKVVGKKLLVNGSDAFSEYADLKFTIDQSKALELLQGANIYQDKFVCIREVIQNAIDSSLIQLWKDIDLESKKKYAKCLDECSSVCRDKFHCEKYDETENHSSETDAIIDFWESLKVDSQHKALIIEEVNRFEKYPINVIIYFDENKKVIIKIEDKGTGISNNALESLANIGTKKDKRTDRDVIKSMPGWLKPSGQFGLGLQSIFLIADKFEMITKCNDEPGKKISFESGKNNKGYITVETNDKKDRGTTVIIYIDELKIMPSDLGIDELSLKLKPKNDFIMEFIIKKAKNNQFIGRSEVNTFDSIFERKNYFNINIKKINYVNKPTTKEQVIEKIECIFFNEKLLKCIFKEDSIVLDYNEEHLNFSYYDHEFKCLCEFRSIKSNAIDEIDGRKIVKGFINYHRGYTINNRGKTYFKNIFICDFDEMIHWYIPIFQYFTFSINILDYKADEFLEISRNAIKNTAKKNFFYILINVLKNAFSEMNNYILENNIDLKQDMVNLYQIFDYLKLLTDKSKSKYIKNMETFLYNTTLAYSDSMSDSDDISMDSEITEMLNNTLKILYPINNGYNQDIFLKTEFIQLIDNVLIQEISQDEIETNKYLINADFRMKNIIEYSIMSEKIVMLNNNFYSLREFRPLTISPTQYFIKFDDINLICIFMKASKERRRDMICLNNYASLITEEITESEIDYIIKLPFTDEHYLRVINCIKANQTKEFNKNIFKSDVMSTDYFNHLVKYISEKKYLSMMEVITSYGDLIDQYLDLLIKPDGEEKSKYSDFIKAIALVE